MDNLTYNRGVFRVDNTGCGIAMSLFLSDDSLQANHQIPKLITEKDLRNFPIRPFASKELPPSPNGIWRGIKGEACSAWQLIQNSGTKLQANFKLRPAKNSPL